MTYNVFGGTLNPAQLNLPVLSFGNCLLKTEVIKWPLKLCVRFFGFLRIFQNPKNMTFYVFLSCRTRFLEL